MRVLVACEFSGMVRDAFLARGHNAWSCDLQPSESGTAQHLVGDAVEIATLLQWDLMIAHPPCTYLAGSGARWFKDRIRLQLDALHFVRQLMYAPIQRIAIENPIGILSSRIRRPDQIIHPWMFGHGEAKATCLWLKNLPKLEPTHIVPESERWKGITAAPPSKDRQKNRSRTYEGVALAMAAQWGQE